MSSFSTSRNILRDFGKPLFYVVTANARHAVNKIVNNFTMGAHSVCLVGSYGTGKSSFLLALENCLSCNNLQGKRSDDILFKNKGQFNGFFKFEFLNIVGDYSCLSDLILSALKSSDNDAFSAFDSYYKSLQKQRKFLLIVIDEFGKILEFAAKNNPEKEMYFLQKFCEYVNDSSKNILFISVLHQGFLAYSKKLNILQRQEWAKVNGRILEVVFNESVEQLLNLFAKIFKKRAGAQVAEIVDSYVFKEFYRLVIKSKFISSNLSEDVVRAVFPLDIFAAYIFILANQYYGQNERTLFTFLESYDAGTVKDFSVVKNSFYNLSDVYDYIVYNFYSKIHEINEFSTQWVAIKIAIERIEVLNFSEKMFDSAKKLVKVVGLLNIFGPAGMIVDREFLCNYAKIAMSIDNAKVIIDYLVREQILRFAKYKSKFILFEGTDVDLEAGILAAEDACECPMDIAGKLKNYSKFFLANAHYFRTGTPRYFQRIITGIPVEKVPSNESVDGFINLVFAPSVDFSVVEKKCLAVKNEAILIALFKNTKEIAAQLKEIEKLIWVKTKFIADEKDRVAHREIDKLIVHEENILQSTIENLLFSDSVEWIFNGEIFKIDSLKSLSKILSQICDVIYKFTPVYKFELINKHCLKSNISSAKLAFLQAILEKPDLPDCGFDENLFPIEKSIYLTLIKNTGMHCENIICAPKEESFLHLWGACEAFLKSTENKERKLGDLISILAEKPFRLKRGFISCWVSVFLIAKKDNFSLYDGNGTYIPFINKEVLELISRAPNNFTVKVFCTDGIKLKFFEKYRQLINQGSTELKTGTLIETIRPFLTFFRKLNNYAKTTKDISNEARKFRDIIANARDPEKVFFEVLPDALGFKEIVLSQDPEKIESFIIVLKSAIRDLRNCYHEFVELVENKIIDLLKIPVGDFENYHKIIVDRYKNINLELMPLSLKNFYLRLIGVYGDKVSWIESIAFVVLNKPLAEIKDSEKIFLLRSIQEMVFLLDNYVEIGREQGDVVCRLYIMQNREDPVVSQIVLSSEQEREVQKIEKSLGRLLPKNKLIYTATLVNLLKKGLKK